MRRVATAARVVIATVVGGDVGAGVIDALAAVDSVKK
jgi:hypothetical protein